ncbi:MAG: DnaA ATPase domain-containing protein, partial [Anaerotignum sp.]
MELKQIWEEALKIIEEETSPVSFETWIQPIIPCGIDGNQLILQVENAFFKEMLEKRNLPIIRNAVKFVTKNEYEIVITTEEEQKAGGLGKHNLVKEKKTENELARNLNPKYVFDSFVVGNSNRMAHAASLAVAEAPAQAYNPLFLYGNSGLGKTHLMHSIGHFILDKNPDAKVLYVTSETFTIELINSIQNNKNEEFRNKYRNIDVLMIDDIQFISKKEG